MGANGNKKSLKKEHIETASKLAGIGCTLDQIAHVIGVSPATLDRMIARNKELAEALNKGRSLAASQVLNTAFKMATSGQHPWMTGFWLKCRLGWMEPKQSAIDIKNEQVSAPQIIVSLPDNGMSQKEETK